MSVISVVVLIANFCVNIAFFGCCTHFSHIPASPYAKWQHRLNKPYASLVDAVSLNTRSTCKLVSSQPFKSVNEERNLDSEINT